MTDFRTFAYGELNELLERLSERGFEVRTDIDPNLKTIKITARYIK